VDTELASPLSLILARAPSTVTVGLSRLLDICVSATLILALAPLWLLIALAVRLDTPGPVFYRQRRVGYRGRLFDVFKFRSMQTDAEALSGPVWAREADPRITRVGRLLRRTRLDEIPQLFNVLLGQMALVGPRPERPHFFEVLRSDLPLFEVRTAVRPGITGWAQIRAPYAADAENTRTKLEYDLFYVSHRSPWFDLSILFETVHVALTGRGAR
jgi:lipopolysaccharide/colanic/teichoic acid biosynthesis glycosyltransferase